MARMIIDGNNVLGHDMPEQLAGLTREELCARLTHLKRFARRPIRECLVVFDGSPGRNAARGTLSAGVRFQFSGKGREADELIIAEIKASDGPRDLFVVTRDRTIQAAARARRARVILPHELIRALEHTSPNPAIQDAGPTPTRRKRSRSQPAPAAHPSPNTPQHRQAAQDPPAEPAPPPPNVAHPFPPEILRNAHRLAAEHDAKPITPPTHRTRRPKRR